MLAWRWSGFASWSLWGEYPGIRGFVYCVEWWRASGKLLFCWGTAGLSQGKSVLPKRFTNQIYGRCVGRGCSHGEDPLFYSSTLYCPVSLTTMMIELQTDLNPTEEAVCVHPVWAGLGVRGCSNLRTIPPALGIAGLLYSMCLWRRSDGHDSPSWSGNVWVAW